MNKEKIDTFISKVNFEKGDGLIPVIVQDASNNNVLMQAFMNKEALRLTLSMGRMHFWSRTKGRIWMKGEESNHYSLVENAFLDCDNDSILFKVQQVGTVCHTGEDTCFFKPVKAKENRIVDAKMLEKLFEIIKERINNPSESSYVSYLTSKGENAVLQKIGEEATELILAIKSKNSKEATSEAADLFFHILVSFAQKDYSLNSIFEELELRHKKKTENLPQ